MTQDYENREHCRRIAEELENIVDGKIYDDDGEQVTLWDYFADCLDIEYRINAQKEYKSVQVMIAFGGPNIYIDTASGNVELYWWTDRASYLLRSDVIKEIDTIFEDYYNC